MPAGIDYKTLKKDLFYEKILIVENHFQWLLDIWYIKFHCGIQFNNFIIYYLNDYV